MLVGERTRHLLGAKMHRHAERGKRRAKFVGDGGDDVVFKLFKTAQAGDVLQDHRGADNHTAGFVHRRPPRQEIAITQKRGELHGILESPGRVSTFATEDMAAKPFDHRADRRVDALERALSTQSRF